MWTHGYTMIAKGMQQEHIAHLRHEEVMYRQLRPIQGKYVPACLGEYKSSPTVLCKMVPVHTTFPFSKLRGFNCPSRHQSHK